MLCIGGFFIWRGALVGREQHGTAEGRAINSPAGCWLACGFQSVGMSTKTNAVLMLCIGGFFYLAGVPSGTRTARHCRRQGNQQPGGLLISARVPISRNVYRGRTLSGGVPSGTRTATTTTAACGRNREELLGPCSDFSKPCQGAAEKSANTTRKALTVRFCCWPHPLGMSAGELPAAVQNSGLFIW